MWSCSFRVGLEITIGAYDWQRSMILREIAVGIPIKSDLDPTTGENLSLKQVDHYIKKMRADRGPLPSKGESYMLGASGETSERFELADYRGEWYLRDNKLRMHLPCESWELAEHIISLPDPSVTLGWRHGVYHWSYMEHLRLNDNSMLRWILHTHGLAEGSWMFLATDLNIG